MQRDSGEKGGKDGTMMITMIVADLEKQAERNMNTQQHNAHTPDFASSPEKAQLTSCPGFKARVTCLTC